MKNIRFLFLLATLIFFSSCIKLNDLAYFQNNKLNHISLTEYKNKSSEYLINTNDVLSVRIKSIDGTTADYMNLQSENGFDSFSPNSTFINGYSVDELGYIYLPGIGKVRVRGLSVSMAREVIQRAVDRDLSNATAIVSLVSFKISILGEVARPGYYYVSNNQLTVFEALALAGDLLEFSDRRNIHLIRQGPEGPMGINLDLTKEAIFTSPYYYILPNDVIYIRPLEVKPSRSNLANIGIFQAIFAGVSTLATLILLFRNN